MSFVPTFQQSLDGHIGAIRVKVHIEVSAEAAEAQPDDRTSLPTLAAVQNTLTLLMVPVFKVLAAMEVGGLDQMVASGPTTAPPVPSAGPRLLNFQLPVLDPQEPNV